MRCAATVEHPVGAPFVVFRQGLTISPGHPVRIDGVWCMPRDQVARIHASSGTTGQPTVVGYTKDDLANWGQVVARSLRAAGMRPGDMLHNAYGYGLFTGGLGIHLGADALGLSTVAISGGMRYVSTAAA